MAKPIVIEILAKADKARRDITGLGNDTDRAASKFAGAAKKAAKFAAVGLGVALVAGAGAAVKFAKAAIEDEQAASRMAQTFQKAAGATDKQIASTEKWITAQGKSLGVTDDELRPALSKLVTATGSVSEAQKLTSLAMDVSAAKGKSLGAVSEALMKAQNGQVGALSRLGINTKNAAGETITMEQATKRMADTFGGAAQKNAETLGGRIDRLKLIASEAGESLGAKILPPLTTFAEFLLSRGVPAVVQIGGAIQTWAADMGTRLAPIIAQVQSVVMAWGATLTTTVIPAVVKVADYLSSTFGPVLSQIGAVITGKVIPAVVSIATFFSSRLVPAVVQVYSNVAAKLKPILDQVAATIATKVIPSVVKIIDRFREWQPTIEKVVLVVVKIIGKFFEFQAAILGKVLPPVIQFAGFLLAKLVPAVLDTIETVAKIIGKVIEFGGAMVNGAQKVAEFAVKVNQKVTDVVGFFTDLPGKIKGAFGSAGTMLSTIGRQIVDGLVAGIRGAYDAVIGAVQGLIDKIPGPIRKAMGIASPSKVMKQIGGFIAQGLAQGIEEGGAAVSGVMDKIAGRVSDFYENKYPKAKAKAEAATKSFVTSLRDESAALRTKLADLQQNNVALGEAKTKLAELTQQSKDYAASVRDTIVGSIVGLGVRDDAEGNQTVTTDSFLEDLRARAAKAATYAATIKQLAASGLNESALKELLAAGVEGGLATAQAIAAGGAGAIQEANALTTQLATIGQDLGNTTAQQFYGSGIQAAQGLVDGLLAMEATLEETAERLAKKLAKAIKKALKIKSPSRVFMGLGEQTAMGLVIGLDDARVARAGRVLAGDLVRGFGRPALSASAAFDASLSSGGTSRPISVKFTAQQLDQLSRGREVRADLDAYDTAVGRSA